MPFMMGKESWIFVSWTRSGPKDEDDPNASWGWRLGADGWKTFRTLFARSLTFCLLVITKGGASGERLLAIGYWLLAPTYLLSRGRD